MKKVIVIGGGLAGLSAAVALAEEGFKIILFERRPFLGGRASSFPVPRSDSDTNHQSRITNHEFVDNCQHVLLRCCTNLLDFYRRLGVEDGIAFFDRFFFLDGAHRLGVLSGSRLPPPLHLLPSLLRFPPLTLKDKLAIAYAMLSMFFDERQMQALDKITMLEWLHRRRQPKHAVETFWRPILVSALNEDIEKASARYGLKVFIDGFLKNAEAYRMGVPVVPLEKLYTEPCLKFLTEHGSEVHLRWAVKEIQVQGGAVTGVKLNDGSLVQADYYVSAVPHDALLKLLPTDFLQREPYFANLKHLKTSPITSVYLWFDREITDLDYVTLLGREVQWVFNKGKNFQLADAESAYLGLVISASNKLFPLSRTEIVEIALKDVQDAFPTAKGATLKRAVVIKEPHATFSAAAGCDKYRPDQKSPLQNFFVAGDWTKTGWPPTMEGAVRSGYRCAELILQAEGIQKTLMKPDLPVQGLARLLCDRIYRMNRI